MSPVPSAPRRRHVILIRHGETDLNAAGVLQGSSIDVPLNDKGQEQAAALAAALAEHRISEIWSSPLKRALETAAAVAAVQQRANPALPPIRVRRTMRGRRRERRRLTADGATAPPLERRPVGSSGAAGRELGRARRWLARRRGRHCQALDGRRRAGTAFAARPPGGESLEDMMVRAQTIKRALQASDAPLVAVVSHGRIMRVLVHVLLDAPYGTVQIAHHNCAQNHLEVDEEGRFHWSPQQTAQ